MREIEFSHFVRSEKRNGGCRGGRGICGGGGGGGGGASHVYSSSLFLALPSLLLLMASLQKLDISNELKYNIYIKKATSFLYKNSGKKTK